MKRLILEAGAKTDLRRAKRYFEKVRPGLGREFLDAVWNRIERLLFHPFSAPVVEYDVRRAVESRFHFNLYYYVEEDKLFIISVIHQRRHPDTWKRRLRSRWRGRAHDN